jgi:alpha 1,3-glucosidase
MRVRRSSQLMVNDPYTLVVALDSTGSAKGDIYLDDFHSFEYQTSKAYIHREFSVVQKVGEGKGTFMTSKDLTGGVSNSNFQPTNTVERIVFMGLKNAPTKVTIHSDSTSGDVEFIFDQAASTLTLRKPNVLIRENWSIILV